jgi:hypothetical protein
MNKTVKVDLNQRELYLIKSVLLGQLSSNKYSFDTRNEMNDLDDKLEKFYELVK